MDNDYMLRGQLKSSGGSSGGPLLNNAAQVLGTYHGNGTFSTMIDAKVKSYILPWGLNQETSRIYVCADEAEWEVKRKLIKPEGNYIEKMNGEKLTAEELDKLRNMKKGYQILSLSDGIVDYQLKDGMSMYIGSLTLYPTKVTPNQYELVFSANEGEGQMSNLELIYDTEKTLTPNLFKRTGYTFTGWNSQPDGKGKSYRDGELVKNLTPENNGKVTLYAQWTLNKEIASVSYIDDTNDKVLATIDLIGNYGTTDAYKTKNDTTRYISQGYKLVSDNYPKDGVVYNQAGVSQKFEVHLTHDSSDDLETKTITRTIHYRYSDGTTALEDNIAKLSFKRHIMTDMVTGTKTYGEWDAEKGTQFDRIETPVLTGFTADHKFTLAIADITGHTKDIELTVIYSPEAKAAASKPPTDIKPQKRPQQASKKQNATKLPHTGEKYTHHWTMMGNSIVVFIVIALLKRKRS